MILKDDYFFLSNFYPCTVVLDIEGRKVIFHNVECAYQAQKNYNLAERFCLLKPLEAKKYGKVIPVTTPYWDRYKLIAMAKALHSKFCNIELLHKLKSVKEEIINDNYWGDKFWGVYKGKGKNILGKMLMIIRDSNNNLLELIEYITNMSNED